MIPQGIGPQEHDSSTSGVVDRVVNELVVPSQHGAPPDPVAPIIRVMDDVVPENLPLPRDPVPRAISDAAVPSMNWNAIVKAQQTA